MRMSVRSSTGSSLMKLMVSSFVAGVIANDARCVISDKSSAACLIVLSNSSLLADSLLLIMRLSLALRFFFFIRLFTYSLYALSDGTLPAEVCGCVRYPISSRSDISLRMVAGLTPRSYFFAIDLEPTGSAFST